MRGLKRRPRVFLSYSHQEDGNAFADSLERWLTDQGCVPVRDRTHLAAFEVLSLRIRQLIESCDALIAVGTQGLLESDYCRQEVEYALARGKVYLPLWCAPGRDFSSLPDWFTGEGSTEGAIKLNQPLRSTNDLASLTAILPRLRTKTALDLKYGIALGFVLFLALPSLTAYFLRGPFTEAGRTIQEIQASVEDIHRRIQMAQDIESTASISGFGGETFTYRDSRTGQTLAQDTVKGRHVTRRTYFRNGRSIAIDRIEVHRSVNGELSRLKTREILISGRPGLTVRDRFDSSGSLIAKEVRWPGEKEWSRYGDFVFSDYPTAIRFVLPYR